MKFTVSLSLNQILRGVYAESALHSYINHTPDHARATLGSDNRQALATLAIGVFTEVTLNLAPYVDDILVPEYNIAEEGDEILEVTLHSAGSTFDNLAPMLSRKGMETAVADLVAATLLADTDPERAEHHRRRAAINTANIRQLLAASDTDLFRTPYY